MRSFLKFIKGTAFGVVNGKRVPADSLEEALDLLAKHRCKGIDTCNGVVWLKDQVTGNPVQLSIHNGAIQVKDKEGNIVNGE